jgi:hypothetical protein
MDLVTYTIPGSGEVNAIFLCNGLKINMVVCVLESYLYGVVVHIAYR